MCVECVCLSLTLCSIACVFVFVCVCVSCACVVHVVHVVSVGVQRGEEVCCWERDAAAACKGF